MALSRWVVTATVVLPADTLAAIATPPGTGSVIGTDVAGHYGITGATVIKNQVIWADSAAGSTGPQLLYQAIGAGNLRAYVQGQDDVGHAGLSNLGGIQWPSPLRPSQRPAYPSRTPRARRSTST